MNKELICPILLDYFQNPIVLPCCGKCISKDPLLIHVGSFNNCPLCKSNLELEEIEKIQVAKNIVGMIESETCKITADIKIEKKPTINVDIIRDEISENTIKKISISNIDDKYIKKSYIIPVIDTSGSMSGSPIGQVIEIMKEYINVVYDKKNILTNFIFYNSSSSIMKTENMPKSYYIKKISELCGSGGTCFNSAFESVITICNELKFDDNITIIFLTDGETEEGDGIVNNFGNAIKKYNNLVIHTVGIGNSHKYEFLEKLRGIGNIKGIYKFADNEIKDGLKNKLGDIFNVICEEKKYNISVKYPENFNILYKDGNVIWTNSKNCDIKIDEFPDIVIVENEIINDSKVWNEWITILIDNIGKEILGISKLGYNKIEKEFYLEILNKRLKYIKNKIDSIFDNQFDNNKKRISELSEALIKISGNETIDEKKINDMNSEGKFKTIVKSKSILPKIICNECEFMKKNSGVKLNKNMEASLSGCCDAITNDNSLSEINELGYNSLDLAVLAHGYWNSVDKIIGYGYKNNADSNELLFNSLKHGYYNTAKILIKNGICELNDDTKLLFTDERIINFIENYQKMNSYDDPYNIIKYGKIDCIDKIKTNVKYSEIFSLCSKFKDEQNIIMEKLIEKRLFDPYEICNGTWLLFNSCENGNNDLVDAILKNIDKKSENNNVGENLNKKNEKGNTCLWISCCNNNYNIVNKLIKAGCDVNVRNLKGDSALIIPCQRNYMSIVQLLLDSGIENFDNINGDNAIIICCRTGKHNILKILLDKFGTYDINKIAKIDGYNALLAATEMNHVECIKILKERGANMNFVTSEDNAIIQGGNAISVACYCGHISAFDTLVKLGVDHKFQTSKYKFSPLHLSIKQHFIDLSKYLLNKYPELIKMVDVFGRIAYDYCDEKTYEELFNTKLQKYILNSGGTKIPEILDKYGESYGCYSYKNLFEINFKEGLSIYSYAYLTQNNDLINLFNKKNIDLNISDSNGISPMYWKNYDDKYKIIENKWINNDDNLVNQICDYSKNNDLAVAMVCKKDDINIFEFIEKRKNKFKNLFAYAKINSIITMHKNNSNNFYELFALYLMSNYQFVNTVNNSIFNWKNTNNEEKMFARYVYNILIKLPKCQGELYYYSEYELPKKISYFLLFSTEKGELIKHLEGGKGYLYIINGKENIVNIGDSKCAITIPGIEFETVGEYEANIFVINQKNIRNSYKKISDKKISIVEISEKIK
jgi:ankyrin repeat protein